MAFVIWPVLGGATVALLSAMQRIERIGYLPPRYFRFAHWIERIGFVLISIVTAQLLGVQERQTLLFLGVAIPLALTEIVRLWDGGTRCYIK
ncbi:MAG: hypothetical protein KDB27_01435 [Planctomycetales bacterium]|nr:hypothetical protein [Planctomycetales bacterium]